VLERRTNDLSGEQWFLRAFHRDELSAASCPRTPLDHSMLAREYLIRPALRRAGIAKLERR
jgi:hypothetical protein